MNSPNGPIEQLLVTYQQKHPFISTPDHTDERGLSTERFYQDALAYSLSLCQQIHEQAQAQGITTRAFRLSRGRRVCDSYLYDLSVNHEIVLHDEHYQECYEYALQHIDTNDLYVEAPMETPLTGREIRESHNRIQADLASDSTYTPRYSYESGPFTSEKREP